MAAELAGFEIADTVHHTFGQGMPHNFNIALAIDKKLGVASEITGTRFLTGNAAQTTKEKGGTYANNTNSKGVPPKEVAIKRAASEEGKQWEGWGTALKPGHEVWWLVQKPIEEDTIAEQVMASGTGGINVSDTRVEGKRWPANTVLSHSESCVFVGKKKVKAAPPWNENHKNSSFTGKATSPVHHSDGDGTETVDEWECKEGCPVYEIGVQSGTRRTNPPSAKATSKTHKNTLTRYSVPRSLVGGGDTGTAARYFNQFFYCSKASRADKDFGGVDNRHPTPKSTTLMDHLCKLITRPGGTILDPFCGSGSTGVSALRNGFNFVGIELSEEYVNLSNQRLAAVNPQPLIAIKRKKKVA
jgi:DNA modification methylase